MAVQKTAVIANAAQIQELLKLMLESESHLLGHVKNLSRIHLCKYDHRCGFLGLA